MQVKQPAKELLAASLLEISEEKPINKITVREIAENCGVSTATFYNHFADKYDLMCWICNTGNDAATDRLGVDFTFEDTLHAYIDVLHRHEGFFHNALSNTRGYDSFHMNTFAHASNYAIERLLELSGIRAVDPHFDFDMRFYFKGFSIAVIDWFMAGEPISEDDFVEWYIELMPASLKELLVDKVEELLATQKGANATES